MSLVQDAPRAALVALGLVLAGLAGCGGGQPPQQGVGPGLGVQLRLADCRDWNRAGPRERHELIKQLRGFAGGPVGTSTLHGATLAEGDAYNLFENNCRHRYAGHFKLYRLYTRAAAFHSR